MRRTALEDIGGFATGTITEDMHTSLRLHKNGWSAVYHAEALAFGLSPANLDQYETQRLRWGRGAMQVWAKEGILFRGRLTLVQRIAYLTSTITYFEGWQKAIIYVLPMIVLLTGAMPIIWTGWSFISVFLLWFLSGMLVNEIFSRGYAKTVWMEEYNFIRFFTFMKATLALVIPIQWRFSVTSKTMSSELRLPVRLWPQMIVTMGSIASILIGSYLYHAHHHLPEGAFIANLVWVTINAVPVLFIKALRFATGRLQQRRSDHRFLIPLVARVKTNAGTQMVIAEDVSSQGLNLFITGIAPQPEHIEGTLLLPNGQLPFSGRVTRVKADVVASGQTVGLQLEWKNPADADVLNSCLYGNSLQWDVNNWAEVRRFRFSRLWPFGKIRQGASVQRWQFGNLDLEGEGNAPCLFWQEADTFRILSYAALPGTWRLSLRNAEGQLIRSGLNTGGYRQYSVGGSPVHMAVLADSTTSPTIFHREPTWIADAV